MKKIFLLLIAVISLFSANYTFSQQKVKASYYANKFHGRKTASGIPYHKDSLTCAHKTYPFGTILKVRNPKNDKEVYVKVTDRGPFIKGRSIDLSLAAAKELDVVKYGVASVEYMKVDSKIEKRIEIPEIENLEKMILPDSLIMHPDNTIVSNDSLKMVVKLNQFTDKKIR